MMNAPAFDGRARPFANYEGKAALRSQVSATDPQKRAANLLIHMSGVARKVCMTVGGDVIGDIGSAEHTHCISRGRFGPDSIDSICRDYVKFTYINRTGQNMDTYLMECCAHDYGKRPPDEFAPAPCMQNAALTNNGQTLVLASLGSTLAFQSVPAQMRRFFGPSGYASRQDVLVAADMDTVSKEEGFGPWVANRKAKRAKKDAQGSAGLREPREERTLWGGARQKWP